MILHIGDDIGKELMIKVLKDGISLNFRHLNGAQLTTLGLAIAELEAGGIQNLIQETTPEVEAPPFEEAEPTIDTLAEFQKIRGRCVQLNRSSGAVKAAKQILAEFGVSKVQDIKVSELEKFLSRVAEEEARYA